MHSLDALFATVTEKFLDKEAINILNIKITFSDVIIILIVLVVGYFIYVALQVLAAIQVRRGRLRKAQSQILLQLGGYIITIGTIAMAFSSVGYSLTYLFVGSTAILVGIGFGLQQLFVDLISGVILLIDKHINLGDVLRVDIPSTNTKMQGRIVHIGLRTTILETIDNEMMIIPNSKILTSGVRSLMRNKGSVRFRLEVLVAYEADMELAKSLIKEAIHSMDKIDKGPEPTIIIKEFAENGVRLEARFWMKEIFYSENIISDLRFKILELFREKNLDMQYPQRVMRGGLSV